MTQIIAASIGSYPRIGEEKDQQRHRRAYQHLQSGELSQHGFLDVQQSVIQEVIREQIEAGLDEVTDGHVTWTDPITKFCENIKGIKIAGLARYFDANFYYRVPVITAKPKKSNPFLLSDFQAAREMSPRPLRTVLTGPFTLAAHTVSEFKPFNNFAVRLSFFAEALREEISELAANGAQIIQIDEPSLPFLPEQIPQAGRVFESLTSAAPQARKILALYFAPLAGIIKEAQNFPFDVINLDFSYDEKKLTEIILQENIQKNIGFGILNSRTTKLEPIDPILKTIKQWIEKNNPPYVYITASTGLEYLPRAAAQAKLRLLSKIKTELGEGAVVHSSHFGPKPLGN